jgi:hypothetical protein
LEIVFIGGKQQLKAETNKKNSIAKVQNLFFSRLRRLGFRLDGTNGIQTIVHHSGEKTKSLSEHVAASVPILGDAKGEEKRGDATRILSKQSV